MTEDDLALVESQLCSSGLSASARSSAKALFEAGIPILASGSEARAILGVPDDGRRTSFGIWGSARSVSSAVATFDLVKLRAVLAGELGRLEEGVGECSGMPLPDEVQQRLAAARNRPGIAGHLVRGAADHMAVHVLELVRGLPGVAMVDRDKAAWAASFPHDCLAGAISWLWQPGPGAFADEVMIFVSEEAA